MEHLIRKADLISIDAPLPKCLIRFSQEYYVQIESQSTRQYIKYGNAVRSNDFRQDHNLSAHEATTRFSDLCSKGVRLLDAERKREKTNKGASERINDSFRSFNIQTFRASRFKLNFRYLINATAPKAA